MNVKSKLIVLSWFMLRGRNILTISNQTEVTDIPFELALASLVVLGIMNIGKGPINFLSSSDKPIRVSNTGPDERLHDPPILQGWWDEGIKDGG